MNDLRGEMAKFSSNIEGGSTSRKRPPEEPHHPQEQPPTKKGICSDEQTARNPFSYVSMQRQNAANRRLYRLKRRKSGVSSETAKWR